MTIIEHEPAHEYHRYPPVAIGIHTLLDSDPEAGGSLAKFHALYVDGAPKVETEAMIIGRASHARILEGRDLLSGHDPEFVVHPETYINSKRMTVPWRFGSKECDEWRDAQTRTVLKPAWVKTIEKMADSIYSDPDCRDFLSKGKPEVVMRHEDPVTGLVKQARFDWLRLEDRQFCDLKSTAEDNFVYFPREALNFQYDRIIAWYGRMFAEEIGVPWPSDQVEGRIMASSKVVPWSCQLYRFSPERIAQADAKNQDALHRLAEAFETGSWPHQTGGVITID